MLTVIVITFIWVCYYAELTILPTIQQGPVSLWFPIVGTIFMVCLHHAFSSTRRSNPNTETNV